MLNIHRHNHKAATIGRIIPSSLCSMQEQQLVPQSSSVATCRRIPFPQGVKINEGIARTPHTYILTIHTCNVSYFKQIHMQGRK